MKPATFIFDWQQRPRVSLAMTGFIALSFLAHAMALYIFQITYPTGGSASSPPARVAFLSASNPDNRAFFKWLDSEDPARSMRPSPYIPPALLQSTYRPSYDQARSLPPLPGFETDFQSLPAGVDCLQTRKAPPPQARSIISAPSQLLFSDVFKKSAVPLATIAPSKAKELAPACFLLGVSPNGRADFVFKQASSGDPQMDVQAETQLRSTTFPSSDNKVVWGHATAVWGPEAYAHP